MKLIMVINNFSFIFHLYMSSYELDHSKQLFFYTYFGEIIFYVKAHWVINIMINPSPSLWPLTICLIKYVWLAYLCMFLERKCIFCWEYERKAATAIWVFTRALAAASGSGFDEIKNRSARGQMCVSETDQVGYSHIIIRQRLFVFLVWGSRCAVVAVVVIQKKEKKKIDW
jgi:hypothetical protein